MVPETISDEWESEGNILLGKLAGILSHMPGVVYEDLFHGIPSLHGSPFKPESPYPHTPLS